MKRILDNELRPGEEDYQFDEDSSHKQHCCAPALVYSSQPCISDEQEPRAYPHLLQMKTERQTLQAFLHINLKYQQTLLRH